MTTCIVSTNFSFLTFPQSKMKVFHEAVMHRNTQGILQCIQEDTSTLNATLEVCTSTTVHLWNAKKFMPKWHIIDLYFSLSTTVVCVSYLWLCAVQKQVTSGQTALHLAAKLGFKDVAKVLLQYKALVTVMDSKGRTPLYLAASSGNYEIAKLIIASPNCDMTTTSKVWLMILSYTRLIMSPGIHNILTTNT